jgi:molecular chaperone HscB
MKYFKLFELEPLLTVDLDQLEKKFHQLSRKYHPDFHTNASDAEQAEALEMTALLNDAYRTLRESTRRVEYLVKSEGFKVDGSQVPKAMLMEVFEINEGLDELRSARKSGDSIETLLKTVDDYRLQIAEKRRAYEQQLQEECQRWDALIAKRTTESERREQLEALADIISQSAYIRNLEHELDEEVSH